MEVGRFGINDEGMGPFVWELAVMKWLVEMRAMVQKKKMGDQSDGCHLKGNDPPVKVSW